jgi:pimeloyl-ACP methyl ester carboxylesterase
LTEKGLQESFAQDLSPAEKQTMFATQAATQGALLSTPIKKAAWHTKPSWFIASNDRSISPEQEASTAKRMNAKTLTLPTSHVATLAQPQEVADFIIEAAASAASTQAPALAEETVSG